ncbi:TraQ conjugal transfer family protein [Spirosoma oryzicola]|uniref:TraQ conjugal transfer family protein n=1 Tax=Spirosoma oryzicola TaxID=2898794 RepID=UPI001E411A1C|nr:TraQ conjugal transfer family protein [Spirosoma oryzicola]UHG94683.1 TraQ conjugal transfer family protein [Spirosoma oryzicola]
MKKIIYCGLIGLAMGCQSESLDIQANYRIRLNATYPGPTLKVHQRYSLPMELLTDSYYSEYGYQLQFYQETGLGRLEKGSDLEQLPILQKVGIPIPLGPSSWQYTPEATGTSQIVLIAQQERGYTKPDTVRFSFQVQP